MNMVIDKIAEINYAIREAVRVEQVTLAHELRLELNSLKVEVPKWNF